jgi:hypothetical protein
MNEEDRSNLRDLHAGFALVGLLMNTKGGIVEEVAITAYRFADAMQEARDQHSVGIVSIKRQTKKEKANEEK